LAGRFRGFARILWKIFSCKNTEFGWPFNQWLYWWMGSGWWGMLLFSGWLLYPIILGFQQKIRIDLLDNCHCVELLGRNYFELSIWCIAAHFSASDALENGTYFRRR